MSSDAHVGLVDETAAKLPEVTCQRRRTYYAANLIAIYPKSMWLAVNAILHGLHDRPTPEVVHAQTEDLGRGRWLLQADRIKGRYPVSVAVEGRESEIQWT